MHDAHTAWLALGFALALLAGGPLAGREGPRPAPGPLPPRGAARLLWGMPLDLNCEDEASLEALPGIGPKRARALVAARPYCRFADLDRVAGIGPQTLRRLRGLVRIERPPDSCLPVGD